MFESILLLLLSSMLLRITIFASFILVLFLSGLMTLSLKLLYEFLLFERFGKLSVLLKFLRFLLLGFTFLLSYLLTCLNSVLSLYSIFSFSYVSLKTDIGGAFLLVNLESFL